MLCAVIWMDGFQTGLLTEYSPSEAEQDGVDIALDGFSSSIIS